MDLPVEFNKERKSAKVVFPEKQDLGFLAEWREQIGGDLDPIRIDAVDFAQLAISRFSAHSGIETYVNSVNDIGLHIARNPKCEVAGIALLKCDWFPDSDVIGVCHFRRSWCNNLVLDYLTVHPFAANKPQEYPHSVRGAGTALVYFLSRIAQHHNCGYIWGEATQTSCGFYKEKLMLDSVEDLILAPQDKFIAFANGFSLGLEKKGDTSTTKALDVEEVYKTEDTSPPLVGNRSAMFSPARRLAYHFLDLPRQTQLEIVQKLGFPETEAKGLGDTELFQLLFRGATERGKLADLWIEVEKKHPQGEPDKNPFLVT